GQVNVPALQVTVYSGTIALPGSPVGGARVMVNFGCGTWTRYTATAKAPAPLVTAAKLDQGESAWGIGTLGDPGFPYTTTARVCAYDPSTGRYSAVTTTSNTNPAGTSISLYMGSGTTVKPTTVTGNCQ
ncbi:MAG: hypothetical protein AAGC46_04910, partial [Solirubrobacteraceae bacterium]